MLGCYENKYKVYQGFLQWVNNSDTALLKFNHFCLQIALYVFDLTDAMKHRETIFIKVHAAEALIFNNYYLGIDASFQKFGKEPGNLMAASLVLAKTNKKNNKNYTSYITTLLYEPEHACSVKYEVAEALAVAGTQEDIPTAKKLLADENTDIRVAAAKVMLGIKALH